MEEFIAHHTLIASIEGDFVIYTCPICPAWFKVFNRITDDLVADRSDNPPYISHSGQVSQLPPEMIGVKMAREIILPMSGETESFSNN